MAEHVRTCPDMGLQPLLEALVCPACGGNFSLAPEANPLVCSGCRKEFPFSEEGIPLLFQPEEPASGLTVTQTVKSFYEENPFPNYENTDTAYRLRDKAERGVFAHLLNEQISWEAKILEAGCGTGQLSNFLALERGRNVFGTDICLNSLKLAQQFKAANHIHNVNFIQMNLFRPVFRREYFDIVVSNGVLHHTADPFGGFQTIARLVKKGGYIIIGLYNRYGRIPTHLRRILFSLSGDRLQFLDRRLRLKNLNERVKRAWLFDQYKHPWESTHTYGEVIRWFSRCGFDFISSIPKARSFESFSDEELLFKPGSSHSASDLFFVQLQMIFAGGTENGFFTMIGRKT